MLLKENFSEKYIRELQKNSKRDPVLLERTVYAFDSALCIAARGKVDADEYVYYVKGARDLRSHIYAENYSPEVAASRAPMVMYMAMCLLTDTKFEKVYDYRDYIDSNLEQDKLKPLKYLKKANLEAYAYVVKVDRLMAENNVISTMK